MKKWIFFLFVPLVSFAQIPSDTLSVAVYDSAPFGMLKPNGEVGGLMVELWEDIAADHNWTYTYELTDLKTALEGLQNKKYDIGLGAISITPKREDMVDFSQAVNPSGTGIATSKRASKQGFFTKWGPILLNLLKLIGLLMFMLLVSACIVWLVERKYVKENPNERTIQSISDGLWWSAVTMTTVGYGDKVPHSRIGKVLGIIWIFISIIFFSLFTAHASAQLNSADNKNTITTLNDLRKVRVVAVKNSSGEEFLIRENLDYTPVDTLKEAIEQVIAGKVEAVVSNVPVLKFHNKNNYQGQLMISTDWLLRNNMGIALQDDSPIREKIDISLLQKIAEPKWQYAVYKYIGDVNVIQ